MIDTELVFQNAKSGLDGNPSEGQVEKDVVLPLLTFLGYTNIQSKVTVKTQAGRIQHPNTQADFIAYEEIAENLPTLVVDAKSPEEGISRVDLPQVQSYAISPSIKPRAKFVMLSSGYATQIYPVDSDDPVFTSDLPTLFERIKEIKEILSGKSPPTTQIAQIDIDNFFKESHDLMYGQDSIKPTQALIIMTKIMLIKQREEKGKSISTLSDILKQKSAYYDKTKSLPEKLLIENQIRSYINNLLENLETDLLPKEDRTIGSQISIPVLFRIIEDLQQKHIGSVRADVQGRAFEIYISKTMQGRELGQYFTPRPIVDFMVNIVNPSYRDILIDPACGTGGFLRQSYLRIRDELEADRDVLEDYADKKTFLKEKQVYGVDKDPLAVQLCMNNMFMWGDSHSHIVRGDGLINHPEYGIEENKFSIVLTNPPFGSAANVKIGKEKIPLDYEMGYRWKFDQKSGFYEKTSQRQDQDAGILFLERCVRLAKPSYGKIGIILPIGVFNNNGTEYVRQWIHQQMDVRLVVSLPLHTFKMANANNFTAILIGQKKKIPDNQPSRFAVSIAKNVGFDENGNAVDKKGIPIPSDLIEIEDKFNDIVGWIKR